MRHFVFICSTVGVLLVSKDNIHPIVHLSTLTWFIWNANIGSSQMRYTKVNHSRCILYRPFAPRDFWIIWVSNLFDCDRTQTWGQLHSNVIDCITITLQFLWLHYITITSIFKCNRLNYNYFVNVIDYITDYI